MRLSKLLRICCFGLSAMCAVLLLFYGLARGACEPTTCSGDFTDGALLLGVPIIVFGIVGIRLIGWEGRHPIRQRSSGQRRAD